MDRAAERTHSSDSPRRQGKRNDLALHTHERNFIARPMTPPIASVTLDPQPRLGTEIQAHAPAALEE
jgi:hypothetical protein